MFRRDRDRMTTIEVVLDAVIEILHKKKVLTRDQIQIEILAKAGESMKKKFKLHEIPRESKIYGFEVTGEPDGAVIIFDHLDGMYSYCYVEGKPDKVVHLSASTPLVKYKDGYKFDE